MIACRHAVFATALLAALATVASAQEAAPAPSDDTVKAFHAAITAGKLDDVKTLLTRSPQLLNLPFPEPDESKQLTPLHTAAQSGQIAIAEFLIGQGAQVDAKSYGATPLFRAAIAGHNDIIKLLLKCGADVNGLSDAADLGDITPIRAAQLYGKTATAQLFLEKGARIDFFSAAGLGWKTYVSDRLEENPTLANYVDHWGSNAAWIAINTGQTPIVDQLVKAGAAISGPHGNEGFTALHIAAERGYTDLAAWLLKNAPDTNAPDIAGRTPLDYAKSHEQKSMVDWLKAHGGA